MQFLNLKYLDVLSYDYLNENFDNDEIIVTLVSDHGQAYISDDTNVLSLARTKVPWFLCGGGIPKQDSYELTENVDVFETLLKYCDLQTPENDYDSIIPVALGGDLEREYVFCQSIYPGQIYKAVIRNKYCEYRYESNLVVSTNGMIRGTIELKSESCINEKKRLYICWN